MGEIEKQSLPSHQPEARDAAVSPPYSELDPRTFAALPRNIRKEVVSGYKLPPVTFTNDLQDISDVRIILGECRWMKTVWRWSTV